VTKIVELAQSNPDFKMDKCPKVGYFEEEVDGKPGCEKCLDKYKMCESI
jgi:hypothetical protein